MFRKLIGACVGLAMMGMAGTANAVPMTIDFDGLAGGVSVTNQFAGVTFSNAVTLSDLSSSPLISIISISSAFTPKSVDPIIVTFSTAAAMVSVLVNDLGENGVRIDAYDAAVGGNLIDFDSLFGVSSGVGNNNQLISVASLNIFRVELYQPFDLSPDGITFDDFTFDIPEPSTLALFATGLALLAFLGWRRRGSVQVKAA